LPTSRPSIESSRLKPKMLPEELYLNIPDPLLVPCEWSPMPYKFAQEVITLHQGREGTWHGMFQRRQQLHIVNIRVMPHPRHKLIDDVYGYFRDEIGGSVCPRWEKPKDT